MVNNSQPEGETASLREVPTSQHMSLRAFARLLKVSPSAVVKGVQRGRLHACIREIDGRPVIVDVGVARHEWTENAQRQKRGAGDAAASPKRPALDLSPLSRITLAEAQRELVLERMRKLQRERDVAEGRLIPLALAEKLAFENNRIIRETLLNLPARIAAEIAADHDPASVHRKMDKVIREALHATADALVARTESPS